MGRPFIPRSLTYARKADISGGPDACWPWLGHIRANGYARIDKITYAHRFAYEQAHGPIPRGLAIDHLCRNRACVNPAHMEAVEIKVNNLRGDGAPARNARKVLCLRGHRLVTRGIKPAWRWCPECHNAKRREARAARASAA